MLKSVQVLTMLVFETSLKNAIDNEYIMLQAGWSDWSPYYLFLSAIMSYSDVLTEYFSAQRHSDSQQTAVQAVVMIEK